MNVNKTCSMLLYDLSKKKKLVLKNEDVFSLLRMAVTAATNQ